MNRREEVIAIYILAGIIVSLIGSLAPSRILQMIGAVMLSVPVGFVVFGGTIILVFGFIPEWIKAIVKRRR